ncbi:hypothetical protein ACWEDZ_02775 [Streptomyces sp. NPDC005047]
MPNSRISMNFVDEEGNSFQIREGAASRLKLVHERGNVGRLQAPGPWKVHEIRALEDRGLWTVDWVEPGDDKREGAWVITGLTDRGRLALAEWNRRVVEGAGKRGPQRTNKEEPA